MIRQKNSLGSYIKTISIIFLLLNSNISCTHTKANMKCYRSFDKFNLEGINQIECDKKHYPYVAVQKRDTNIYLSVFIKEEMNFDIHYVGRKDFFVKKEDNYFEEEVYYPYTYKCSYYADGIEYSFLYFLKDKRNEISNTFTLGSFSIANSEEKIVYEFPVFEEKGKIVLKEEIDFYEIKSFEKEFLNTHAIGIKKIVSQQDKNQLILITSYKDLSEEGETITTKEVYSLKKYPKFYINFVAPFMYVGEIEEEN